MISVKGFFSELRRRKVIPTIVPYIGLVWLILQIISVITPLLNLLPIVGTFVTVILFSGFPIMLYLSWYYDFTLEGLKKVPEDTSGEIKPLGKLRWAGLIVIVLGSILLGTNYYTQIQIELSKKSEGIVQVAKASSIAVMPFDDHSPEKNQAYLAMGLAEELTGLLGKFSDLSVAASRSVFALDKKQLSPIDIGKTLNVDALLSGSIVVIGDRLSLRTELIEVKTGKVIWTEKFTRQFQNIFEIEEQISRSVVNLLQERYLKVGAVTTEGKTASTDAYIMYLKGREQYRKQTTESMQRARKLFDQAIALDPEYAQAYVGAADSVMLLAKDQRKFGVLEPEIAAQLAEQYLAKAFIRSSEIPEAYAIQGKVFELQKKVDEALSSLDKAISLNPNLAIAHMWRFTLLENMAQFDESQASLETAFKLDPINIATKYNVALNYVRKRDFKNATILFNELIEDFPESPFGYEGLANAVQYSGELAQSIALRHKVLKLTPENINIETAYYATILNLGLAQHAQELLNDSFWRPNIFLRSEQFSQLFEEMDFQLASNPLDGWIEFEAGWYHLLVGDKQKGINLVLAAYEHLDPNDLVLVPNCIPAMEIAWALNEVARTEEANILIEKCAALININDDEMWTEHHYLAARIAAFNNENDQAIIALKRAIDGGWREWWTPKDPLFTSLASMDEAQALFIQLNLALEQEAIKAEAFLASLPKTE